MHHLLPLKVKIGIIVVLAAATAGVASWLGSDRLGLAVIVGIVEFIVIHILLRSWGIVACVPLIPRPAWMKIDLSGKWTGEIRSQWRPAQDAAELAPIPATLQLSQTWSEVVFSLSTDKMRSRSTGAVPSYDPITRELRFKYFLETEPTATANDTNPPQRLGSAMACVRLDAPDRMSIRYTNERSPGGDIELRRSGTRSGRRR
jgi:SMODS-associating 2TM, beta-strand rich effector domain